MSMYDYVPRRRKPIMQVLEPYLFVAPMLAAIFMFSFYIFGYGAKLSLTDAQGINTGSYIGLANFKELLTQYPNFWLAIQHTLIYAFGCLLTQIPAALVLAVVLNSITSRFRGLMRASFYVPVLINSVVTALLFRMLFNRDTGMINYVMGLFHLPNNTNWLFLSELSIPIMIAVSFWQWTGYHMVYFLASLQAIDPTIYEVAKLDGCSRWRTLAQITVPLIRPAIAFVMITSAMGGLAVFDIPFLLFPAISNSRYGPGNAAMTAVPFVYDEGMSMNFRWGFSAAGGWLIFIMIFAVSFLQIRFLKLGQADEM